MSSCCLRLTRNADSMFLLGLLHLVYSLCGRHAAEVGCLNLPAEACHLALFADAQLLLCFGNPALHRLDPASCSSLQWLGWWTSACEVCSSSCKAQICIGAPCNLVRVCKHMRCCMLLVPLATEKPACYHSPLGANAAEQVPHTAQAMHACAFYLSFGELF